ncbi:hypothetical protein BKM03_21415 [Pseudomonas avellanae]|uniref:Uncharacterized protein n=1 Tax=Pseudomonas avellanae TaxID=46257 RepID=A0AAD0E0R4_9PSED|nr:hypothetical protein BKM03_21415 [Pseudomonas avellanae]
MKSLFCTQTRAGNIGCLFADSTTLGHSAHDHLDTHSKLTWTPAPRPLGQAVGAQRHRFALLV